MGFNDKVKVLNGFINVFGRNVLLMVTLTPYDCYDLYRPRYFKRVRI